MSKEKIINNGFPEITVNRSPEVLELEDWYGDRIKIKDRGQFEMSDLDLPDDVIGVIEGFHLHRGHAELIIKVLQYMIEKDRKGQHGNKS